MSQQLGRGGTPRTPSSVYRTPHRRQQMNPSASYTNSKTWISPGFQAGTQARRGYRQLNESRKRVCQNSPFWHTDFELQQHRSDWKCGEVEHQKKLKQMREAEKKQHKTLREPGVPFTSTADCMILNGRPSNQPRGHGTLELTVFCDLWEDGKDEIAPWPGKHEMEYEGEGRIATDRLHRRFLPLPRVESNGTVNWQHRALVPVHPFEDYYTCGYYEDPRNPLGIVWEDVFFRMYRIEELEFTNDYGEIDEEGQHALGADLIAALGPQGQWT